MADGNLLRVNKSLLHPIMDKETETPTGRTAVTLGLQMEDGTSKIGNIYVGDKAVHADKKDPNAAYVGVDPKREYDFIVSKKREDGSGYDREQSKISGGDLVDMNRAYLATMRQQRGTPEAAAPAPAPAEAQAQA